MLLAQLINITSFIIKGFKTQTATIVSNNGVQEANIFSSKYKHVCNSVHKSRPAHAKAVKGHTESILGLKLAF